MDSVKYFCDAANKNSHMDNKTRKCFLTSFGVWDKNTWKPEVKRCFNSAAKLWDTFYSTFSVEEAFSKVAKQKHAREEADSARYLTAGTEEESPAELQSKKKTEATPKPEKTKEQQTTEPGLKYLMEALEGIDENPTPAELIRRIDEAVIAED